MACNIPIVSTDVGDVRQNIENLEGCYLTTYNPKDVAKKIDLALQFGKRTNGRERLLEFGLDNNTIAKRIIELYRSIFKNANIY